MTIPPDKSSENPSWLKRLSNSFFSEPENQQELWETLQDAAKRDILDADALAMIEGVLNVSRKQVRDIMIPRSQMVVVEIGQPAEEFLPIIIEAAHSRFPVIGEDKDDVVGILLAKEVLKHVLTHPNQPFILSKELLRPAFFVPESKRLDTLLKEFRSSRTHLAVVVDEYGGIAGLVTIEDVLEQIVGEIEDEYDSEENTFIQAQGNNHYLVNALTSLEDFNKFFKTNYADNVVDTIGGLITLQLGHVPIVGDNLQLKHLKFQVVQADRRRAKMLQVSVLNDPTY